MDPGRGQAQLADEREDSALVVSARRCRSPVVVAAAVPFLVFPPLFLRRRRERAKQHLCRRRGLLLLSSSSSSFLSFFFGPVPGRAHALEVRVIGQRRDVGEALELKGNFFLKGRERLRFFVSQQRKILGTLLGFEFFSPLLYLCSSPCPLPAARLAELRRRRPEPGGVPGLVLVVWRGKERRGEMR